MGRFEDLKLTINGENQAKNIALYLKNQKITAIYSSPMQRALQTAEIVSSQIGVEINQSELLKDRDMGVATGMAYKQVQKQFASLFKQSTFEFNFRFPEGESNGDVFNRAQKFIENFFNSPGGTNETLVIISHSLTLNYLIYILQNLGFQPELLYLFEYGMCAVINKEYGKSIFRMIEFRSFYNQNQPNSISSNL